MYKLREGNSRRDEVLPGMRNKTITCQINTSVINKGSPGLMPGLPCVHEDAGKFHYSSEYSISRSFA